jgi:hypothetical protein
MLAAASKSSMSLKKDWAPPKSYTKKIAPTQENLDPLKNGCGINI